MSIEKMQLNKEELPLVTMVSVFYNRANSALETIESMKSQSYKNIEILLVDDGSTDYTLDVLNKFQLENIKIITGKNVGFTKAIKNAIEKHASGEYIAIQGSGDISHVNRIETQIELMLNNKTLGLVGCGRKVSFLDGSYKEYKPKDFFLPNKLKNISKNIFSHGSVIFSKKAYDKALGYNEFFEFAQDYDLWLRINKYYTVGCIEEVLYNEFSRVDGVRNDYIKVLKQQQFMILALIQQKEKSKSQVDDHYNLGSKSINKMLLGSKLAAFHFLRMSLYFFYKKNKILALEMINESIRIKSGLLNKFLYILLKWKFK